MVSLKILKIVLTPICKVGSNSEGSGQLKILKGSAQSSLFYHDVH